LNRNTGLAAAGCALALLVSACEQAPESVVPLYDVARVETRPIQVSVDAAGVIEPELTIEVKSKASGEILAVHADSGDFVQSGTLLVEVDKRTPRNQLAEAEASLVAARARRNIAETQMNRAQRLHESGTLTQADFEQTQLEFANATSMVVSAEVSVENARIAMDDTDVRAPITGTIIEKHAEPGIVISSPTQAVSDGTVLMRMADLRSVQVRTRIDETDIGKIIPGMPAQVIVAAFPNQPFSGEVLKIEPMAVVEQNVTMFPVLIRLDNESGLLRPGMNAQVEIRIADRSSVAVIPTMALRTTSDIPATAAMLGLTEDQFRRQLQQVGALGGGGTGGADGRTFSIGGREVALPEGVDAERIASLMERRRSGGTLSAEDQALIQQMMSQMQGGRAGGGGGFAGGGGFPGGGAPGGFGGGGQGGAGGGFPGGAEDMRQLFADGGGRAAAQRGVANYQFGGDFWVIALRNGKPEPVAVRTGLTDLEYSELVAGLAPGDEVVLLPSSSLFEQQARLQQFISERFSSTPFGGGQSGGMPGMGGGGIPAFLR
jgi:HlyD family secretion protein